MSNLHHHPHTKLQPPAVPNQHRTSSYPARRRGTCSKHSRVWPLRGHRPNPTACDREPGPCRYSGSLWHKNLQPARHFQEGSARPQRGWTGEGGEPRPQPRPGEGLRPRGRAGPNGSSAPLLGLTATPPPPDDDTTEPPVQPDPEPAHRAAAASALLPPGGAAPHGQAPGRPRSRGGEKKERGRGGR